MMDIKEVDSLTGQTVEARGAYYTDDFDLQDPGNGVGSEEVKTEEAENVEERSSQNEASDTTIRGEGGEHQQQQVAMTPAKQQQQRFLESDRLLDSEFGLFYLVY